MPEDWKEYWYVESYGMVDSEISLSSNYDKFRLNTGNCFATEAGAKKHQEKLHAIATVTEYIWDNDLASDDQEFKNDDKAKYLFFYNCAGSEVKLSPSHWFKYYSPIPYIKDQESAEHLLSKFPKELELIYK